METMTTFDELAELGAEVVQQIREADVRREQRLAQEKAEEVATKLARLREKLGVTDTLWEQMQPQYYPQYGYTVRLAGRESWLYLDLTGWKERDFDNRPVNQTTLALAVLHARDLRSQAFTNCLACLRNGRTQTVADYAAAHEQCREFDGLWESPEIVFERVQFLRAYAPKSLDCDPDDAWYTTWLQDAAALGLPTAAVTALREKAYRYRSLLDNLYTLRSELIHDEPEQLAVWIAAQPDECALPEAKDGLEYRTLLGEAIGAAVAKEKRQQCAQRVAELETAAFYPFRYFRVYYGLLVDRYTDEADDTLIEEQSQEALTYPTPGGEYIDAHGKCIRALHISRIETINVLTLAEMPWFAPCLEAEDGTRYRVPPVQCERLTPEKDAGANSAPLPDAEIGLDAQYHCYQCQQDFILPVGMAVETCPLCGSRDWQLPF